MKYQKVINLLFKDKFTWVKVTVSVFILYFGPACQVHFQGDTRDFIDRQFFMKWKAFSWYVYIWEKLFSNVNDETVLPINNTTRTRLTAVANVIEGIEREKNFCSFFETARLEFLLAKEDRYKWNTRDSVAINATNDKSQAIL